MKTRKLRLLSALLALAMMLALLPTAAFADDGIVADGTCGAEDDGSNVTWSLENGTLTISGTGAMADYGWDSTPWYNQKDSIKQVVIENGVTNIGNRAFHRCKSLESITIPSNVISIGEFAFIGCASLKNITIPSGVTSIGMWAFNDCISLESITIPSGVTSINDNTFYGCTSLESVAIPSSVTSIGKDAFNGCTSLKSITIPSSVTSIGICAFWKCTSLESIAIPSSVTSIGTETFWECTSLKSVTIPSSVTSIGWGAFNGCTSLESITIPLSVTSIGQYTFYRCYQLKKVIFESPSKLQSVFQNTFESCPNVTIYGDENVKQVLVKAGVDEGKIETYPSEPTIPDPEPKTYPITIDYGTAYDADHNAITKAAAGDVVTIEANETAFDGMVFEHWEVHEGNVKLENDHAAKTYFIMPEGEVKLEAMYKTENDDTSWDAATVVTGVAIGTGTAILAYHIGTELYAEQVLGKDVAVPRTRAEVALLAWQLAGSPTVELNGEPLSEAAQAERWAVESGLMQLDAEGNFNGAKKMSKLKALRTLEKAKQ